MSGYNYDAARKTKKDGRISSPQDRKTAFSEPLGPKINARFFMTND